MPMSYFLDEFVEYIYTAVITPKNGKHLYASQYGLKAFRISVKFSKYLKFNQRMLAVSSFPL